MRPSLIFKLLPLACGLLQYVGRAAAADCQTATVGSPFSTCFDIYTNAGLTADQFAQFNPGLDCSVLQIGQKVCISAGTLPSNAPMPFPNGTCAEYTTVPGDSCSAIATMFDISIAQIEQFNNETFKWGGCSALQADFTMCVSPGTPPPIPIIAGLQCGPQSEGNATCPLNACCSAFGFCGLTDDFCTTSGPNPCISNCFTPTLPSCSSTRSMRKIGYYAGFGDRRSCGINITPDEVDWTGFTGAHFAFATITQDLQIQLDDADVPLLQTLVAQKATYPGLQVIIAVGGWDFSEMDPTRDLFSFMIASSSSRATFISSVNSFLTQFKLDGIDIDFEYPSAIERDAPPTDTPNLTSFFQELRAGLGSNVVISCATPAGYWFLKGFEIDKIASSVTYLNMMSYDYHGPWDTNVTDQAPVTNPHTSILDMHDSALLYIRAGIDMSIVNLGLAYYARSYELADASCKGYNCTMVGGGTPGDCTLTPGILAQFEVDDLLNSGISATLDSDSETFWIDTEGSLFTFDQQETWAAKTTFAGSACFGGTFIWSMDQNTDNLVDGGSGSGSGAASGGEFSGVVWNPNPFPSPGAVSETFVQQPGTVLSTFTMTVGTASTTTLLTTITIPEFASPTTQFTMTSGTIRTITGTTTLPASTTTLTFIDTFESIVTSTTLVTKTATTVIIPVPSSTTSVVIQGVTITLNSGGTPVNSPVPTFISQPSAVTPTWTANISPPPNATIVTFTAPLTSTNTFSTTVPVPSKSDSPPATVTGPPGDHSRCSTSTNIWTLLFHAIINGCLPADVGIQRGITPTPLRPQGWTGPWTDPFPLPTGGPPPDFDPEPTGSDSQTETSTSTSTSSTFTGSCPTLIPAYDFSDDPENTDSADLGTDPDRRRRREVKHKARNPYTHGDLSFDTTVKRNVTWQSLERRAPRKTSITVCSLTVTSPTTVNLGAGVYYWVPFSQIGILGRPGTGTTLIEMDVASRPSPASNFVDPNQEHIFEIQYMGKFFNSLGEENRSNCDWIQGDVIEHTRVPGLSPPNLGQALLAAIDNQQNMVWVDKPMNQAKSNVVNNNRGQPAWPPQAEKAYGFVNFDDKNIGNMIQYETFLRNFAALGQYFSVTNATFRNVAANFQTLLSEITPRTVPNNSTSIPTLFRNWLIGILADYPSGCTSRAENAWNLYRDEVSRVARDTGMEVPPCLPLFISDFFAPSSFNFMDLIPAAPTTPSCNVPGTSGTVGYISESTTVESLPLAITPQRIMGSGNTNFYAVGSGASIADTHYQAVPSMAGSGCDNVVGIVDGSPGSGLDANIAFQCNGATGPREADFDFVVNGQSLGCVGVITGHAGGELTSIYCAVSQGDALDCLTKFSGGAPFTVQMRWFPS